MRLFVSYIGFFFTISMFVLVGLFFGPSDATLSEITSGLIRSDDGPMKMIIWSIRIPRIILSLLTGCCLGLSGALIQLSFLMVQRGDFMFHTMQAGITD